MGGKEMKIVKKNKSGIGSHEEPGSLGDEKGICQERPDFLTTCQVNV